MRIFKKICNILLFPHIAIILLLIPVSTALLIYAFAYDNQQGVLCYFSYFISAYTLTVVCIKSPFIFKKIKTIKKNNKYIVRYFSDNALQIKLSLYSSLTINTLYAVMQLFLGIYNRSIWFYALSAYYIFLCLIRFFLLKETRKDRLGQNIFFEYLHYRLCGIFLLLINTALSVIVIYILKQNRGFEHHYIITIAMAAYTFFTLTKAIINIIRYRKSASPIIKASKVTNLAAALVSLLSLETAMLTAFGNGEDAAFRRIMTASTGAGVCLSILAIAIYMIVRSTKEIKIIKGANTDEQQ